MDCMLAMKEMSDNQFDLAIVDPPYGIDIANDDRQGKKFKRSATKRKNYGKKDWDTHAPSKDYFIELKRVSMHQIIWGVNYYKCSKINSVKSYKFRWNGMLQHDMKNKEIRIHPTQKPVSLYEWLLMKYAKEGDKILDTHLGGGSIAIACHNLGYDLTGYEIDKEYYNAAIKRINQHKAQKRLF